LRSIQPHAPVAPVEWVFSYAFDTRRFAHVLLELTAPEAPRVASFSNRRWTLLADGQDQHAMLERGFGSLTRVHTALLQYMNVRGLVSSDDTEVGSSQADGGVHYRGSESACGRVPGDGTAARAGARHAAARRGRLARRARPPLRHPTWASGVHISELYSCTSNC